MLTGYIGFHKYVIRVTKHNQVTLVAKTSTRITKYVSFERVEGWVDENKEICIMAIETFKTKVKTSGTVI